MEYAHEQRERAKRGSMHVCAGLGMGTTACMHARAAEQLREKLGRGLGPRCREHGGSQSRGNSQGSPGFTDGKGLCVGAMPRPAVGGHSPIPVLPAQILVPRPDTGTGTASTQGSRLHLEFVPNESVYNSTAI